MKRPIPFPKYPRKLDKIGRLRIKINGRCYYLPKPIGSEASIAEYERLRLEHAAGRILPHTPKVIASAGNTVEEVVAKFLRADPRGMQDKEIIGIGNACRPLIALYGQTQAGEFTAMRLREVQSAMINGSWTTPPADWSGFYINKQMGRIVRVFGWAESMGLVPMGIWHHLCTVPALRKNDPRVRTLIPRRPVDWDTQVKPCLAHLPPAVIAILTVIYHGGCRPGEACRMRRCEVDKNGPDGTWLFKPGQHKRAHTGRELVKVLGPMCQAVIAPWFMAAEPDGYLFVPARRTRGYGPYTVPVLGRAVLRAVRAAGVTPWTPYGLRHAAKRAATRAFGLDFARAYLGQASLGSTNEYATEVDLQSAATVAKRIG